MTRPYVYLGAVLAAAAVVAYCVVSGGPPDVGTHTSVEQTPSLSPDYAGCVIPPNIAPLNFVVKESGERFFVRISAGSGEGIDVVSASGRVVIPPGPWKRLLDVNRGGKLTFDVYVQQGDGTWWRFAPVVNTVAPEDIDPYLVYREMPVYNLIWTDMSIRQRNLQNYDESVILSNQTYENGCANCHTFLKNRPDSMLLNVRRLGKTGPPGGLTIVRNGAVERIVSTKTAFNPIPAIYLAWHPDGKIVSFSTNKVLQCFHSVGYHRDTVDTFSDVALYLIETNTITTTPEISRPDRLETYPTWTPDGQWLYYCSAPQLSIARYREALYDVMRIPYDAESDTWGKPERVISAADAGLSAALPRISPDGKWLLFCMMSYGNFAAFSPSSDLYMMDMKTGKYAPLDINSPEADAYHSWSSNSRWFVFSSKRLDGFLARPYLSYVDETGKAHKPVLLPQKDPAFYDAHIRIYNVPELTVGPVTVSERDMDRALYSPGMTVKAALDPRVVPQKPVGPDAQDTQYEPGPGG